MTSRFVWISAFITLCLGISASAKDDWQSDLHRWTAASQIDPQCKTRYVTGVYRPDLGDTPVWGFMTEKMFKYFSKDGAILAPSVCPATRTTQNKAEYRILFSVAPMRTFTQTTHGSEAHTTTEPFNANVSYSDGSTATIQGQQTSTVVVPTETTVSRSSVAVYMYTYRVMGSGDLELISTDNVVFSRVAASGSGNNAAGAELGAGIGNLIRQSKDRHRIDKLCVEALKAIFAEAQDVGSGTVGNPTTSLATAYQSQGADKALPAAGPSSSGPSAATNQLRASGSQTANDAVPPIKPASFYNAAKQSPNADAPTEGTASITSEPGEADIFIDSVGQGRAPALL